jgi:hypothetical protein
MIMPIRESNGRATRHMEASESFGPARREDKGYREELTGDINRRLGNLTVTQLQRVKATVVDMEISNKQTQDLKPRGFE